MAQRLGLPSLAGIMALALVLRLVWIWLVPVIPVSDASAYLTLATNLAEHGVYGFRPDQPSGYWAVGTAAIYAAAFLLLGTGSAAAILSVNLLSSLATVWLLHDLGRRWSGEAEGRLAALVFALWPLAIQFTTVLASELHFIALILGALAFWDRVTRTPAGACLLLGAGVLVAAATYVRPIALLVPAALAVAEVLGSPRRAAGAGVKAAVATALVFALVAPWTARNERVFGEPVFMSTNFWPNFWMGNHAGTDGAYTPLPAEAELLPETRRSDYMKALALQDLRADPSGFAWRTIWKSVRLHDRETIGVEWNREAVTALAGNAGVVALKVVSTAYWYAALAAALAGVWLLARRGSWYGALLSPPVWLWLYFTAVHGVIVVGDRYHMPAIPLIALLAGVTMAALARNRAPVRSR
jgi:4-amino-4-deoxy-L-arabinose transferase-like glycosyltransferase